MNSVYTFLLLCLLSLNAHAAVTISNAWARTTAPGQEVGAAYMTLKSDTTAHLIKAETSAAGTVEIHEMSMNNGVMKMRMMEQLELPAAKAVVLAPGGFHFMLFDLKKPLVTGDQIELVLTIKDAKGKPRKQMVKLPVKKPGE